MAEEKFYGMKNDYMFKAVLQSAQEVLNNLVAVLLGIDEEDIKSCKIQNAIELGKSVDSKDCVLDVKLILNSSEVIDLEMQVRDENNWPERSLLYWSRTYDSIKHGQEYSELKKTYHIGILDFTLFDDNPSFYAEYKVCDTRSGYVYSDKLNIRILDLTRIRQAEDGTDFVFDKPHITNKLIKWAKVFQAKTINELEQLAGDEEVMKSMVSHIKELSEDERIRLQCQAREDYERRLLGAYRRGTREGIQQGKCMLLVELVDNGSITVDTAASMLDMSVEDFKASLNDKKLCIQKDSDNDSSC